MALRTLAIVNPSSASGATAARWPAVEARLREVLGPLEVEFTRGPRDARRIAREGVRAGCERVLAVGGDGTLSEVATGLLAHELAGYAQLGLLPMGSGNDYARSLGVPLDLPGAIEVLARGAARPVDAIRVNHLDRDGGDCVSYSVNVTSFGISGLVNELKLRGPSGLGGRLAFLLATLRAVRRYRAAPLSLALDGKPLYEGALLLGAAANGRWFGGGMQLAPTAALDDALFDVVLVTEVPRRVLFWKLASIYRGAHLDDAAVSLHRGRVLEARGTARPVPIEIDGELLGSLPARCELLPQALSVIGPAS